MQVVYHLWSDGLAPGDRRRPALTARPPPSSERRRVDGARPIRSGSSSRATGTCAYLYAPDYTSFPLRKDFTSPTILAIARVGVTGSRCPSRRPSQAGSRWLPGSVPTPVLVRPPPPMTRSPRRARSVRRSSTGSRDGERLREHGAGTQHGVLRLVVKIEERARRLGAGLLHRGIEKLSENADHAICSIRTCSSSLFNRARADGVRATPRPPGPATRRVHPVQLIDVFKGWMARPGRDPHADPVQVHRAR